MLALLDSFKFAIGRIGVEGRPGLAGTSRVPRRR
jgi:hypothetical protein